MRAAGSAATPPTPARRVVGAQELHGQLIDGLRRWQRFPDRAEIDVDVSYSLAEDPVEAMTFLTAAIATSSSVTIERAPIEFLEVELAYLSTMGLDYRLGDEYAATNGRTRLADITTYPSELTALIDKIHPMPFPGINIDNLPFFALVGAVSNGETLITTGSTRIG